MEGRILDMLYDCWNAIAMDVIQSMGNRHGVITGALARNILADHVEMNANDPEAMKSYFEMSTAQRRKMRKKALPLSCYCM